MMRNRREGADGLPDVSGDRRVAYVSSALITACFSTMLILCCAPLALGALLFRLIRKRRGHSG